MFRRIGILTTLFLTVMCSQQKTQEKITREFTDEEFEKHYELKSQGLEKILGKSHDVVGHAIIPFEIGGAVDMYYFPNALEGTGFATMELIQPDGTGPIPNRNGTYELVAFTKLNYVSDTTETNAFNLIERRTCGTFTAIGNYSLEAKLEPGETIEIPEDDKPNKCLIFDEYKPDNKDFIIGDKEHGLLLVIEVFRNEMEYAMENGSSELLKKLKEKGFYPYSDLDRPSVIE
ncbi:suppressor of fused domain protein [Parachryseolinea silvisoli]|uniref:suppressor of fused domain protein n=1 Tax=Parachryseolinea silvisoli TaxID=2873601 RepID=UPI002265A0B7|nr:suppressor of fused domain protein [Parachryseolinea silvisoli]MCD9017138.1 suppressor of fused domain protein [Parachryseolinea silvisoli]